MESAIKISYYKFLKKLILFTLIIAAAGFAVMQLIPDRFQTPTIAYLYVFFFSTSILVHYILLRVSIKRTMQFINYFMLLTFGKLIFYLSLIMVYILVNREDAIPFVGAFFILYIFFTVFEVNESLSLTRQMKEAIKDKNKDS